jgi:hypothetical protein
MTSDDLAPLDGFLAKVEANRVRYGLVRLLVLKREREVPRHFGIVAVPTPYTSPTQSGTKGAVRYGYKFPLDDHGRARAHEVAAHIRQLTGLEATPAVRSGPRIDVPTETYLVTRILDDGTHVARVGVGGLARQRAHLRHGWTLERAETWEDRGFAQDIERAILRGARGAGAIVAVDPDDMPQSGWTECFDASYLPEAHAIFDLVVWPED